MPYNIDRCMIFRFSLFNLRLRSIARTPFANRFYFFLLLLSEYFIGTSFTGKIIVLSYRQRGNDQIVYSTKMRCLNNAKTCLLSVSNISHAFHWCGCGRSLTLIFPAKQQFTAFSIACVCNKNAIIPISVFGYCFFRF